MTEHIDEILPAEPNGALVQWMDKKPLALGPAGVSATAGGAFVLGALVTVAALTLMHLLGPERELRRR